MQRASVALSLAQSFKAGFKRYIPNFRASRQRRVDCHVFYSWRRSATPSTSFYTYPALKGPAKFNSTLRVERSQSDYFRATFTSHIAVQRVARIYHERRKTSDARIIDPAVIRNNDHTVGVLHFVVRKFGRS